MRLVDLHNSKPKAVDPTSIRLVVIEDSARGFESRVPPDAGVETIVVAQTSGELPADLVIRVASRIAAIERSRRKIGRAILLVGERRGVEVNGSRWLMARAFLSHMLVSGGGELVVDADRPEVDVRHGLLSLVEALLGEFEQGGVPIRLQFRREPPPVSRPSGVYAVAEPGKSTRRLSASERE